MVTSTRMPLFTRGSWSEVSRISALLPRETVCVRCCRSVPRAPQESFTPQPTGLRLALAIVGTLMPGAMLSEQRGIVRRRPDPEIAQLPHLRWRPSQNGETPPDEVYNP